MLDRMLRLALASALCGALALASVAYAEDQEGYATWYGPGFHGNITANGEIFDENNPTTTASNMFPFGTWLRVTNPHNGKSVTVRVNDRGAFKHALDLSKAAFFALAPPNPWAFTVRYQVVPGPNAEPRPTEAPPSPPAATAPAPAAKASAPAKAPAPAAKAAAPVAASAAAAPVRDRTDAAPAGSASAPTTSIGEREYVVAPGDTLLGIAEAASVPLIRLIELNELHDANLIRVGQRLRLRPEPRYYEVEPGDTLGNIAEQLGIARSALLTLNELDDPDLIRIGQKLVLPDVE